MTNRDMAAPGRWRRGPVLCTFLEFAAWAFAFEAIIVFGWIVPSGKTGPIPELALILGLLFLLFTLPMGLVAGSGLLMRLVIRPRAWLIETVDGNGRPKFYWPREHYLQALLSAVAATVVGYLNVIDAARLPPYWVAFPWCVEGLTLLGILGMRTLAFGLCFQPGRIGAWAAETWPGGAWDRLGDLLVAASLSFLIVTCVTMGWFVGSGDEFPRWCAWVMVFSLVPLGLMLAGRGALLVSRRVRGAYEDARGAGHAGKKRIPAARFFLTGIRQRSYNAFIM